MSGTEITQSTNIYAQDAESASGIKAEAVSDFVTINLGKDVSLFLRDLTVVDALEAALAQARLILTNGGCDEFESRDYDYSTCICGAPDTAHDNPHR